MREVKNPVFHGRGEITYNIEMISELIDIENALNICYAAKKAMKEDVLKIEDFLKLSHNGKYYTLKNCELPIAFCYNAIFIDGFKDCLKKLTKRLEEILIKNEEIYCLKVSKKTKKKFKKI